MLAQIRSIQQLLDALRDADPEDQVEVGSILWALSKCATEACDSVKRDLRARALKDLGNKPGTIQLRGSGQGTVSITVPHPRIQISKGTDMVILKKKLGEDFPLYFEEIISYKPHMKASDRVIKVASDSQRSLLLDALEEVHGTPKVSFKREKK